MISVLFPSGACVELLGDNPDLIRGIQLGMFLQALGYCEGNHSMLVEVADTIDEPAMLVAHQLGYKVTRKAFENGVVTFELVRRKDVRG